MMGVIPEERENWKDRQRGGGGGQNMQVER